MGWNGSNSGSGTVGSAPRADRKVGASVPLARKPAPRLAKGIIAGLIVIIGAGIAAFIIGRGGSPSRPQAKKAPKGLIEEVKPQIVTQAVEIAEQTPASPNPNPKAKPAAPKNLGTIIPARTSRTGQVMTLMDGTVITNYPPAPIFERDLERSLQVALRPGGMSRSLLQTMLQRHSETEIIAMLQEMTVADPDDNDSVRAIKADVQDLKEKILIEVKNGRSVADVFAEISRVGSQENAIRVQAMKARAEAIRGGDAEDVRDTVALANETLEKNGLPLMKVPEKFQLPEEPVETPKPEPIEVDDGFVPEN